MVNGQAWAQRSVRLCRLYLERLERVVVGVARLDEEAWDEGRSGKEECDVGVCTGERGQK